MTKFAGKKWYSGTVQLSAFPTREESTCKWLVQGGKTKICLADIDNLITLRYLESRVKVYGRLLSMNSLYYLEAEKVKELDNVFHAKDEGKKHSQLFTGRLISLNSALDRSQEQFHCTAAETRDNYVLLKVEVVRSAYGACSLGEVCHVVLMDQASALLPYLSLHQAYHFASDQQLEPRREAQPWVVLISHPAAVQECVPVHPVPSRLPRLSVMTECIVKQHPSLLRPHFSQHRESLMHTEMDVTGEVLQSPPQHTCSNAQSENQVSGRSNTFSTCAAGERAGSFIELAGGKSAGDKFLVYYFPHPALAPAGLPALLPCLRKGAVVTVHAVLPVYLWGRLHGFAATPRSRLVIKRFSPLPLSSTCSNIPPCCCESELKGGHWKSLLFTAWWSYAQRRVVQAVSSNWKYNSATTREGVGVGGLSAFLLDSMFNIPSAALESNSHLVIRDALCPEADVFHCHTIHTLEVVHDKDCAQLLLVRGGWDADFLCSRLPEVWTAGMTRQFGENSVIYYNRKAAQWKLSKKSLSTTYCSNAPEEKSNRNFRTIVSFAQSSLLRHETAHCPHTVLLVGTVHALLAPQDKRSGIWCLSIADSSGDSLLVLISCSNSHCTPYTFESDFLLWAKLLHNADTLQRKLVVTLANPAVLAEVHPQSSEQNAQILVVVQSSDVRTIWESGGDSTQHAGADRCDEHGLEQSVAAGKFISSRLSNIVFGCDDASTPPPAAAGIQFGGNSLRRMLSVREVLMTDVLTVPGEAAVMPCVRGVVVWKEFTPHEGYYHILDPSSSQNLRPSMTKRRKISLPKCVVHLRDTVFGDVVYMYMPAPAAVGVCVSGLVVNVFNCKLKLSANRRHIFLDFDINESFIGVADVLSIDGLRHLSDPRLSEVMILNQPSAPHGDVPKANIYDLYQNHYRNRCMWRLSGRFVLAKEVNIYMRCNRCHRKANVAYASRNSSVGYACSGKDCGQNVDRGAKWSPLNSFHVWWHGILVFDDGSGEVHVNLEGSHLLDVLNDLSGQRGAPDAGGGTTGNISAHKVTCFANVKASVEKHVLASFSLVSYSFSREAVVKGYSSLQDSDHGVCSEDSTLCASTRNDHQRGIGWGNRSVQSVYNDYFETNPANLAQLRFLEKRNQIQLLNDFLRSCSFASTTFDLCGKIIFPRYIVNSCSTPGLAATLRRALSRLDSSEGSITGGGTPSHIRQVKVQCANVPPWRVENVELPSEALTTLQLQCLQVKTTHSPPGGAITSSSDSAPVNTTSEQAWALLRKLRSL